MPRELSVVDYPFLIDEPVKYLVNRGDLPPGFTLLEAVEARGAYDRVLEIIRDSLSRNRYEKKGDPVTELVAFHTALAVLEALGDRWAVRRLGISVSKSVSSELYRLEDEKLVLMARLLGFALDYHRDTGLLRVKYKLTSKGVVSKSFPLSTTIYDYIKWSARLRGDPYWKMTNSMVVRGRVYLDRKKAIRLLQEVIAARVEQLASRYSGLAKIGEGMESSFSILLDEARKIIVRETPKRVLVSEGYRGYRGPILREAFPPCIKRLLEKASSGSNLSHHERFVIATFLINIGASEDEVVDVFRNLPDFKEKITRYQVQHLMGSRGGGKKYLPYNCETMKTLGLCVADCGVKTPLQYYRRAFSSIRKRREDDKNSDV